MPCRRAGQPAGAGPLPSRRQRRLDDRPGADAAAAHAIQRSAAGAHASQSAARPQALRRLDLLGRQGRMRWLIPPHETPRQRKTQQQLSPQPPLTRARRSSGSRTSVVLHPPRGGLRRRAVRPGPPGPDTCPLTRPPAVAAGAAGAAEPGNPVVIGPIGSCGPASSGCATWRTSAPGERA